MTLSASNSSIIFQHKSRVSRKTKNFMTSKKTVTSEKKSRFVNELSDMKKKIYPDCTNEKKNVNEFMDLDQSVEMELPSE